MTLPVHLNENDVTKLLNQVASELNKPFLDQPIFFVREDILETLYPLIDVESLKFKLDVIQSAIVAWGFLAVDGFHDENNPWEFDVYFPHTIRIANLPIFHQHRTQGGEIQGIARVVSRLFPNVKLVEAEILDSSVLYANGHAISTFAQISLPMSPSVVYIDVLPSE